MPITNPEALSVRIDQLLSDSSLRSRLSSQARLTALEYDHNRTLPKISSIIESCSSHD